MMPELDGFGLLRELRADETTRAIPVIMLSARAGEEARVEGLEAGAGDYLVKPFAARELLARVSLHLELGAVRRAAEHERARLRGTFEQAPFPIAVFEGPLHRIVLVNERWRALANRSFPEGRPLAEVVPELREQALLAWHDRAFAGETIVAEDVPLALDVDGARRHRHFHLVLQPLLDADGAREGHIAMALDVSERVRARAELDAARREAESANRAKDEFLAMLGHELRNPLSPMVTALQLMRMRGKTSREQEVLERQVAHLTRLVDDLLDVSRITRGQIELRRAPAELADVVARAIETASPLLEQRRHRLELDVPRGLRADVDLDRMAQVVANLLTNAAKYSASGSTIRVEARQERGSAIIAVKDEGVGVEPAMADRIFDAFVQRSQTLERAQGGLGLGLAIVKSLVTLHGGTVSVRSDGIGKGSEFLVALSVVDDDPLGPGEAPARARPLQQARRVLVVDDNHDAAEMLRSALELMGYDVATAGDGLSALQVARDFAPEIALLDIGLPVMNGYELAPKLRDLRPDVRLTLVAVTGYGQEEDRRRSTDAGFDAHLVKPVDVSRLEETLNGLQRGPAAG
jgi:signal transduction histidine kinase